MLNHLAVLFAATLHGLFLLIGQAAHGDLAAIGVLVWLVVVARIALRPPRRRRRRPRHISYPGPPPRPLPTRRIEVEPAPPKALARPHGHPEYCPCKLCRPAREAKAALRVPEPSDRVEPGPCRHELIARVRVAGADGELWRYACANWRCDAVWPPDTRWPAGTRFTEEET